MFSEGKTWEEICEKVVEDKSKTEDIFQFANFHLMRLTLDSRKRNQLEEAELIPNFLKRRKS